MFNASEKEAISQSLAKRDEFERQLVMRTWEDEAFKQELLGDPKAIYAREMGQEVPDLFNIQVLEEGAATIYLVIPRKPEPATAEGELTDGALEVVAGGRARNSWLVATRGFIGW